MDKEKNAKKISKELTKLLEENKELQDKSLRFQAEMINMRKKHDEEITRIHKYEGEDIIINILSLIDNFERAINLDDNNLDDELSKFLSGFKMIHGNFVSYLKSLGVEEIIALGQVFDPYCMEAVNIEHLDGVDKGVVIDTYQKGYKYKDKVIRPAMVKVNE